MAGLNSCSFTGHITRDAESRIVGKDEKEVASFGIAVNGRREEDTIFINCDMWEPGKTFDYLQKGKLVGVSGELRQRTVEKGGSKTTYWTLNVRNLALLGSSEPQGSRGGKKPPRRQRDEEPEEGPEDEDPGVDGDIPF